MANRIEKTLEDANIKLSSVATDVLGASGHATCCVPCLIAGQTDAAAIAQLARFRLRVKIPQLVEALGGRVTEHHRFMLRTLLGQVEYLEQQIELFD